MINAKLFLRVVPYMVVICVLYVIKYVRRERCHGNIIPFGKKARKIKGLQVGRKVLCQIYAREKLV